MKQGMIPGFVMFCLCLAPVFSVTSAWATVAANTQIIAQAELSYFDGVATRTATASVTITVEAVATAPLIVAGSAQSASAGTGTTLTDSFTITATSNGPDTYTLSAAVVGCTNTTDPTVTLSAASMELGATITTAGSTDTLILVSADGAEDDSVNGIETGDTVVINHETRMVNAISDNAADTSSITLDTPLSSAPDAGTAIAEQKIVTATVTAGTITQTGTDATVDVTVSATAAGPPEVTISSAPVTNTFLSGQILLTQYVRNITAPNGTGTPYVSHAHDYYLTGVTAKPGDMLEYLLVASNRGSGSVTDSVVTASVPATDLSLNTGGYGAGRDIAYIDENGAVSYLTAAPDADAAVYDASTLSLNIGTGATNTSGGIISSGQSVLILYQATVSASTQGDKIISGSQLTSPDTLPAASELTVTVVIRTASVLEMLNYAPSLSGASQITIPSAAYQSGSAAGPFVALSAPVPVGHTDPIDLSQPVPLANATQFHQGDPLFIRVTDPDQNLDTTMAETVIVTISNSANHDTEVIRLTETGLNTGDFTGFLPTSYTGGAVASYNGSLSVNTEDSLLVSYVDRVDGSDVSVQTMMIDPYGTVLDTGTGLAVDGATITIQDATGGPVTVYGDDGISTFPSTIISGGTARDSSGRAYAFPTGEYRFPFLVPGQYRFLITPPEGYGAPSAVATETIQALPGGPFHIVPGSRGETFAISAGPAVRIDIPIDPFSSTLWMQKKAGKEFAGHGDFIPYRLTLTNTNATLPASGIQVFDRMPAGFRLRKGSIRIDGVAGRNPDISADGRTLTFDIGTLEGGAVMTIDYVAEVSVGARLGQALNSARAVTAGIQSNTARAAVTIRDDFLRTHSTLMGRVTTGACDEESGEGSDGVEGVRIYLEDGTFVISDQRGLFHFEGVREGLHVVQLDLDSLPEGYEPYACAENSRFAGRAYSQFVETRGGALWRTDFHIRPTAQPSSAIAADAEAQPAGLSSEGVPDMNLQVHFPILGAELSGEDRQALDELAGKLSASNIEKITVTGYTDDLPIVQGRGSRYKNNRELSLARAQTVGRYLMDRLHVPPEKLVISGKGYTPPAADNHTEAGRARNRKVTVSITAGPLGEDAQTGGLEQKSVPEGGHAAYPALEAPIADSPAEAGAAAVTAPETPDNLTIKDREGILSPQEGAILADRIAGIRICLDSRLKPRLLLDGNVVAADRIGFTMKDEKAGKTLYSYIGIDFGKSGEHVVELQGMDPFGNIRFKQAVAVKRCGQIASIHLLSADGNVADGKTPVKMRLELRDIDATPIPAEVDLEIREGKLSPLPQPDMPSAAKTQSGDHAHVHVNRDGEVLFQPVSASGPYRVVLAYNEAVLEAETYVQPAMRDWILVGLAEGTAGYNTVSGNMENLQNSGVDEDLYENGRVALFAKGQIKGKCLLTMSYDSDKPEADRTNGLFQTIDPDTYYTLYGDATRQLYDAPSAKKLYVKIEREQFYALFGDYDTGMTVTEMSRYSRRMTGIKTELQAKNYEVNAFASQSDQVYQRDEIPGDGTSGIYRLSHNPLMPNTETITIEVRDRFQSEKLLSSRTMTRFTDYSIDYDSGTVIFKEPIYGKDEHLNPIIIVVEYELMDEDGQDYTYGGRAGVKLFDNRLKAGGTYIHEGQGERNGNLYGADTTIQLDPATKVRAEIATSDYDDGLESRDGNAYLAEISRTHKKIDAKTYYREQETDFGLGQQPGSEAGTRKFGIEGTLRLKDGLDTKGNAYRQYNLQTDAIRDVAEARLDHTRQGRSVYVGFLHAKDHLDDGDNPESNQVTLGGRAPTLYKRLTLTLDYAQSILRNENSDFPTRVVMGAEYQATKKLTLLAAQEFTWGEDARTQGSRLGMRSGLWEGAALTSGVEREINENDERVSANAGLKQTWQINSSWKMDAGLDRSQTIASSDHYHFNTNVAPASGAHDDYTAVSSGVTYQVKHLIWDNRFEVRAADSEDKWGLMSGLIKEIDGSKAWTVRAQVFQTLADTSAGTDSTKADLRLGTVYRPVRTAWIVLDRLDFLIDKQHGGTGTDFYSWRIINNLLTNYRPYQDLQLSLHYGAKYVRETIYENDYRGYTDFLGLEGRYDIDKHWDVGLHGSIFHSWHAGQFAYCEGTSIGYNVVKNAWISLGYNITGFKDRDFSRANFTAQGPFVRFRFKFDQDSVREAATWVRDN